jgi:hypothetical protein
MEKVGNKERAKTGPGEIEPYGARSSSSEFFMLFMVMVLVTAKPDEESHPRLIRRDQAKMAPCRALWKCKVTVATGGKIGKWGEKEAS